MPGAPFEPAPAVRAVAPWLRFKRDAFAGEPLTMDVYLVAAEDISLSAPLFRRITAVQWLWQQQSPAGGNGKKPLLRATATEARLLSDAAMYWGAVLAVWCHRARRPNPSTRSVSGVCLT